MSCTTAVSSESLSSLEKRVDFEGKIQFKYESEVFKSTVLQHKTTVNLLNNQSAAQTVHQLQLCDSMQCRAILALLGRSTDEIILISLYIIFKSNELYLQDLKQGHASLVSKYSLGNVFIINLQYSCAKIAMLKTSSLRCNNWIDYKCICFKLPVLHSFPLAQVKFLPFQSMIS